MSRKNPVTSLILLLFLTISTLLASPLYAEPDSGGIVTEILDGTRTKPDPLWEEILLLQEDGVVTAYRILDTVPVQISVTGPVRLVDELRRKYRR